MATRGREVRKPVVIITEGATERGYLEALRHHQSTPDIRRIIDAKGGGGVIGALTRADLDAYAEIWVVLDAEAHPHGELQRLRDWLVKAPHQDRFRVVVTSPRFEAWLLAHFETPEGTGAQMEKRLAEQHGFRKPRLPRGLPLDAWAAAAEKLPELACGVPDIDDRGSCVVCRPASAMVHVVRLVTGTPG